MDLFEYQARDIFEAHGVPVLRGIIATTPEQAVDAARQLGTPVVVVKAQVKTGGRGKAGGVKLARSPEEAGEKAAEILGLDIKGLTVETVMVTEGADIAEEYYFSVLLDRAEPPLPGDVLPRGRHGDRAARRRAPRGPRPRSRSTRWSGSTPRRRPRSSRRPASRPTSPPSSSDVLQLLGRGVRVRGRDAGRGQPAGQDAVGRHRRPRRQGLARRERGVPAPGARGARRHLRGGPARGGGQGQGPQLRQARRRGRHHRQRRGPGHEHPGRRRVRRLRAPRRPRSRRTSSTSAAAPAPR